MTISSRTPEGEPHQCPLCGACVRIEPSRPTGDAPCPACGHLLWFHTKDAEVYCLDHHEVEDILAIFRQLGWYPERQRLRSFFEQIGGDSLDVVEFIMDLEEELDVTIPAEESGTLQTVEDVIVAVYRARRRKKREC